MDVLIVGGGIGGPALATFLAEQGKNVTLVERSSEWKNIGFGVTIWGIGRKVLQKLGIEENLVQFGHPVQSVLLTAQDETGIISLDFEQFARYGGEATIVPRAKLHELILQTMPATVRVVSGTTVENIKQEDQQVCASFSNGTTEIFDLIVGADGVLSNTREFLGVDDVTYYGWSVIVFWVPDGVPCSKDVICISEAGRTLCFYPTKDRTFIAIANYNSVSGKKTGEDFIIPFIPYLRKHGWEEADIRKILSESHSYFVDDMKYIRMGAWSKNNVALLGDARHGFAPIIGMGANLALEDAFVLAEELGKVDVKNIPVALAAYAKRRTPRVNKVRALSRFVEPWFNTHSRAFVAIRKLIAPYLPKFILMQKFFSVLRQKV